MAWRWVVPGEAMRQGIGPSRWTARRSYSAHGTAHTSYNSHGTCTGSATGRTDDPTPAGGSPPVAE